MATNMETLIKTEKTIEKHMKAAQKFADQIEKEISVKFDLATVTRKEIAAKMNELFDSLTIDQRYLFMDLESKLESAERAQDKLDKQKVIAEKNEAKEQAVNAKVENVQNLPKVILDFLEKQKNAVIEYFVEKGLTNKKAEKIADENEKMILEIMIGQVTDIVGTITDAKGLHIAGDASINGVIIGTKGKADINTFIAGGYNIQKAHYRTRVTAQ